jgi:transposase
VLVVNGTVEPIPPFVADDLRLGVRHPNSQAFSASLQMAWLGSGVAGTIPIRPCADWPHLAPYLETCSSAHHWARQLMALGFEVRLIPHAHVKPYVRRNNSDAADAAVICEAARRPGQRFAPVHSIANQAELMRHRARELLAG